MGSTKGVLIGRANPATAAVEFPAVSGPLYVRADALIPDPGGYLLSETKAKTFPLKKDKVTPDKPEDHLIDDVAIQLWTLTNAGVPIARADLETKLRRYCQQDTWAMVEIANCLAEAERPGRPAGG